jgi:hypothetical protein
MSLRQKNYCKLEKYSGSEVHSGMNSIPNTTGQSDVSEGIPISLRFSFQSGKWDLNVDCGDHRDTFLRHLYPTQPDQIYCVLGISVSPQVVLITAKMANQCQRICCYLLKSSHLSCGFLLVEMHIAWTSNILMSFILRKQKCYFFIP